MIYRAGRKEDIDKIMKLVSKAIIHMEKKGIYQWDENYPIKEDFLEDIEAKELYLLEENDTIVAIYTINQKWDGEYDKCTWHNKSKTACVIHRLCVLPAFQNKGIGKAVLNHIENQAKEMEYESVRLDVFSKNPYAIRLYENNSYEKRGNVFWRKGEFYLMEKKI